MHLVFFFFLFAHSGDERLQPRLKTLEGVAAWRCLGNRKRGFHGSVEDCILSLSSCGCGNEPRRDVSEALTEFHRVSTREAMFPLSRVFYTPRRPYYTPHSYAS